MTYIPALSVSHSLRLIHLSIRPNRLPHATHNLPPKLPVDFRLVEALQRHGRIVQRRQQIPADIADRTGGPPHAQQHILNVCLLYTSSFGSGLAISERQVSKKTVRKRHSAKYVQKGKLSGQCGYGKLLRTVKIGTAIPADVPIIRRVLPGTDRLS